MKANKGFKTTKKTHLFATRGFLTFLVFIHFVGGIHVKMKRVDVSKSSLNYNPESFSVEKKPVL